jgi:glycosyltransferase involved in cell wall biosynthesis
VRIRLLVYGPLETTSGGYLYDRQLVGHLRDRGDDVEVICLRRRPGLLNLLNNLRTLPPVIPDLVLEDELCHASLLRLNRVPRRYPIISIVHNLGLSQRPPGASPVLAWLEQKYLSTVDGFVFNSTTTRDSVLPLLPAPAPYLVAEPGGDRLGQLTSELVVRRARRSGRLRLLFLANVIRGKGLDLVLRALERAPSGAFAMDVVGSCDVEPRYARAMKRAACRLETPIVFHGVLDGEALQTRLRDAHVLVLPSRYEGFGIAVLEAMAYGLAIVVADVGAVPRLVTHGFTGIVVPADAAGKLAAALRWLAADRSRVARLGSHALEAYLKRPTWLATTERIRKFLRTFGESDHSARPQP